MTLFNRLAQTVKGKPNINRQLRNVVDLAEVEGSFLQELQKKGYLGDWLENRSETLSKEFAPRLEKFLDPLNPAGYDYSNRAPLAAFAKTAVDPMKKTDLDLNRMFEQVSMDSGIFQKRAEFNLGLRGGDVRTGENPIRRVHLRGNDLDADYRQLMGGQSPKQLFGPKTLLANQGPMSMSQFRNDSVIKNKRAKWGLGMNSDYVRTRENPIRQVDFSNEYRQLMTPRRYKMPNMPRPMKRSPTDWMYHGKSAVQLGTATAGAGLIGYGLSNWGSGKTPEEEAAPGLTDLAVGMVIPRGDRLGPQMIEANGPMSFSSQSIGRFSPDRMGATGDLTLALHNKRRG